jgi:hypothetical protein
MKKLASLLGVLGIVAAVPMARAAIQISYAINGGPPTVCANNPVSSGPTTCSVSGGGANIQVLSASSNSPGTPALAQQFGSTLFITTTSAVNITVWMSSQDFTAPITPPDITYVSSLSTTSTTGTGKVDLTSCVDTANGLTPPTTAFCSTPASTLTNNTETYNGASSTSDTVNTTISSLSGTYALAQVITMALGAGSNLNVITSQALTPVPEPASVALIGGVVLFAASVIRRKVRRA